MKSRTAVAAIVAFVVIATASAVLIVRLTAATINATAAAQAAEAPEIARLYIAKYGSLEKAAPSIVARITREGLRVVLIDDKSRALYAGHGRPRHFSAAFDRDGPGTRFGPDPPGAALAGDGPGAYDRSGEASWRSDWLRFSIAMLAGERVQHVRLPGGRMAIIPGTEPIIAVVRSVMLGLALVFAISGAMLWLYVRSVRRAALRPLYETTLALQRLAVRDFSPRTIMTGEGSAYDDLARAYNAAAAAVSSAFAERRAAEAEMQRFIADAGHELRTPLTIVMGYLDIIDGGALADPTVAKRITNGMRVEAGRMRRLVEKLIILARMETPSDADARINIDVVSLAARVIESLEALTGQPIDVAGVPFAHVFANEDDVADALTNIIENAIKYAPLSPIAIDITRRADRVVIYIADRGPGMTTDEQRNAFERFYRGDKRGEVSGSGLGLAIAKRAIERAGGTIELRSAAGTGTTVTIELPELPISIGDPPAATPLARRQRTG